MMPLMPDDEYLVQERLEEAFPPVRRGSLIDDDFLPPARPGDWLPASYETHDRP